MPTTKLDLLIQMLRDGNFDMPLKTDEQGRLILASDVIVDVGDISVGTVQQGARGLGVEPWQTLLHDTNGDPIDSDNPLEVRVRELEAKLTALQTAMTDGTQKVQLTGTVAEITTLVNAQAITDTDTRYTTPISFNDLKKYRKISIWVETTLNEELRFNLMQAAASTSAAHIYNLYNPDVSQWAPNSAMVQGSTFSRFIALTEHPHIKAILDQGIPGFGLGIRYKADNAPIAGSLTIVLVGEMS